MARFKVANNETSYDSGIKPFKPDDSRGVWSSNWDFFWACITHSFGLKTFSVVPFFMMQHGFLFFLIPFTIGQFLFVIPILFIQSFLGQFSSSGFISVFRIAPLFKGIGYVILILNFTTSTYYAVLAGLPLYYFFNSLSPNLPFTSCNNSWNTNKCTVDFNFTTQFSEFSFNDSTSESYNITYEDLSDDFWEKTWPAIEFFDATIGTLKHGEWHFPWKLFFCTSAVWLIMGYVLTRGLQLFGKIIRCIGITLVVMLSILFIRFIFTHESLEGLKTLFMPAHMYFFRLEYWLIVPFIASTEFGSGWSTTLTLASYNSFKCDIGKIAIMVSFSHMLIALASGIITFIVYEYASENSPFLYAIHTDQPLQFIFSIFPLLLGSLGWSNLWFILFYFMLFLAEFSALAIQIFSILTALFDEYEQLRVMKKEITIGLVIVFVFTTLFFSTNHGIIIAVMLYDSTSLSQMLICFLELMVVVWVYGRERFQRDVQFMLGQLYPTWRFYLIRFITPFYIFLAMLVAFFVSTYSTIYYHESDLHVMYLFLTLFVTYLPVLFIPIYMIIKVTISSGTFVNRIKRLCHPNDWYPANKSDYNRYEITTGNAADIAQQLIVEDFEEP